MVWKKESRGFRTSLYDLGCVVEDVLPCFKIGAIGCVVCLPNHETYRNHGMLTKKEKKDVSTRAF